MSLTTALSNEFFAIQNWDLNQLLAKILMNAQKNSKLENSSAELKIKNFKSS